MEEGGFTLVTGEEENTHRSRGTDGVTSVPGVKQDEAKEYSKKNEKLYSLLDGEDIGNSDNKMFYKFQIKELRKSRGSQLQKDFQEDKKRLAKLLRKKAEDNNK